MRRSYLSIKKIWPSRYSFIFSFLMGLSIAAAVYLGLLQRHFFSWRYLFYALFLAVLGFFLTGWINHKYLIPRFRIFPKKIKFFILAISFLLSAVLLINCKIQPFYYVLPDSDLEISFQIPELSAEEEGVRLLWVKTGQGFIHYTNMEIEGEWERYFGNTKFKPGQKIRLTWTGKAGHDAEIAFRQTMFDQTIQITWNGVSRNVNLNDPQEPVIYARQKLKVPVFFDFPFILTFLFSVMYGLFSVIVLLGSSKLKKAKEAKSWSWLMYMLPALIAWLLTLLVFWPGIMSNDSLAQWGQGATGEYNDWQSAFHALLMAGLMRIWYSPAIVSICQISFFALAVAWGLKAFEDYGVHQTVLWGISFLFAVFPPNVIFSATLWKDVPYAIAFLWLTAILVRVILSGGKWAQKPLNWLSIGISAFLISIFRQNGVGIALVTLIFLPFFYRRYWKQLTASLVFAAALFILVKGPVYTAAGVDRSSSGQSNLIYLHHIAAHLEAGTGISQPDRQYLDGFMPLHDWEYWCCYVGTISYDGEFDRTGYLASTTRNRNLAISLFLKKPFVDISHATCAGELAWKFENNQCYMKSTHGINRWSKGRVDWIGRNEYDIKDDSLIPEFVDAYISSMRGFGFFDDFLVFYLRPAFWLYLSILSVGIAVIRKNRLDLLLSLLPVLSQTLILILVSFAPAYRYYYGTCLAGIYLLGMIFLPSELSK